MNWQLTSALVILAAPVLIGGYDLVAFLISGNQATISRLSLQTAREYPVYQWSVCFLFGLLCGHLFSPSPNVGQLPGWLSVLLFVILPALLAFGALILGLSTPDAAAEANRAYPLVSVLVWLTLGAVIGSAFLPQSPR